MTISLDQPLAPERARQVAESDLSLWTSPDSKEPVAKIRVAGVTLEQEGRVLRLATEPHPSEGLYRLTLNDAGLLQSPGLEYTLNGVVATWTPAEAEPEANSRPVWLPSLNLGHDLDRLKASSSHAKLLQAMKNEGSLELHTLVELPEGEIEVSIESHSPFEGELTFIPIEAKPMDGGRFSAVLTIESFGEGSDLRLIVPRDGPSSGLPNFQLAYTAPDQGEKKPVAPAGLILPWAPPRHSIPDAPPTLPENLMGGDPGRGEAIYFGDQAKCSSCHRVGDRGEQIGPNLTHVAGKYDAATIYREIESPSAWIAPDYLPWTVATIDGRVLAGIVRAEGPDSLRVSDTSGKSSTVLRSEVAELQPSATSIMPVGLAGVLGEAGMRDLLAFLLKQD